MEKRNQLTSQILKVHFPCTSELQCRQTVFPTSSLSAMTVQQEGENRRLSRETLAVLLLRMVHPLIPYILAPQALGFLRPTEETLRSSVIMVQPQPPQSRPKSNRCGVASEHPTLPGDPSTDHKVLCSSAVLWVLRGSPSMPKARFCQHTA